MHSKLSRSSRTALAIVALILAGLVVPAFAMYRRDVGRARARIAARSQIAQTPCGPIEYAVAGNGPPVVSGFGGSSRVK